MLDERVLSGLEILRNSKEFREVASDLLEMDRQSLKAIAFVAYGVGVKVCELHGPASAKDAAVVAVSGLIETLEELTR